jgi:hypothetical protein
VPPAVLSDPRIALLGRCAALAAYRFVRRGVALDLKCVGGELLVYQPPLAAIEPPEIVSPGLKTLARLRGPVERLLGAIASNLERRVRRRRRIVLEQFVESLALRRQLVGGRIGELVERELL